MTYLNQFICLRNKSFEAYINLTEGLYFCKSQLQISRVQKICKHLENVKIHCFISLQKHLCCDVQMTNTPLDYLHDYVQKLHHILVYDNCFLLKVNNDSLEAKLSIFKKTMFRHIRGSLVVIAQVAQTIINDLTWRNICK